MKYYFHMTFKANLELWRQHLVLRWRVKRARKKWNRDVPWIIRQADDDPENYFKWICLLWQEIEMWIILGKKVGKIEFDVICKRRGFNDVQQQYIVDMLSYIRLMEHSFIVSKIVLNNNSALI